MAENSPEQATERSATVSGLVTAREELLETLDRLRSETRERVDALAQLTEEAERLRASSLAARDRRERVRGDATRR